MTHMSRRITPETYRLASKVPVRIVLENIRSGLNVGAFFRTGDALRIDGIDLCGYTARPPHREILKSAVGATEHVTWMAHDNALKAIESLLHFHRTANGCAMTIDDSVSDLVITFICCMTDP